MTTKSKQGNQFNKAIDDVRSNMSIMWLGLIFGVIAAIAVFYATRKLRDARSLAEYDWQLEEVINLNYKAWLNFWIIVTINIVFLIISFAL